jgi:sec-independent protein translocase protein TatA
VPNFGGGEMLIVFIIVLLIFGPSQLPKLAKGMGNAMREFRKAQHEISDELNRESTEIKPAVPSKSADATPPENKPIQ